MLTHRLKFEISLARSTKEKPAHSSRFFFCVTSTYLLSKLNRTHLADHIHLDGAWILHSAFNLIGNIAS